MHNSEVVKVFAHLRADFWAFLDAIPSPSSYPCGSDGNPFPFFSALCPLLPAPHPWFSAPHLLSFAPCLLYPVACPLPFAQRPLSSDDRPLPFVGQNFNPCTGSLILGLVVLG